MQKDPPKNPNYHFWRARSKYRVSGAKAGHCSCPLHTTPPKGWADHLSHGSSRPLDPPPYSPHVRSRLTPPQEPSKGTCCLFLLPSAAAGAPVKPGLSFLSGLWSTSTEPGRPRTWYRAECTDTRLQAWLSVVGYGAWDKAHHISPVPNTCPSVVMSEDEIWFKQYEGQSRSTKNKVHVKRQVPGGSLYFPNMATAICVSFPFSGSGNLQHEQ